MNRKFWHAVFTLVGTTIGAGIFGLPYVFAKAGFFVGVLEILFAGAIALLMQQIFGEIALRTPNHSRLIGYSKMYLPPFWDFLSTAAVIIGSFGILLVYLVLGGNFLSTTFSVNQFWGTIAFFALWFFAILVKPAVFGRIEFYLVASFIFVILLVSSLNFSSINLNNFWGFHFRNFLVPYGVILFSIVGYTIIPEMEDILVHNKKMLKKAITIGTLIPILVYLVFTFIVVGISGSVTSQDAISGLAMVLNSQFILRLGAILGLLAISGAALSQGIFMKESLWYDLHLNKWVAWFLTGIVPLALFFLGARDFIVIMSLVGAVIFGFRTVMTFWMHQVAKHSSRKPEYEINLPVFFYYIIGALVIFGAIIEVWYSFYIK